VRVSSTITTAQVKTNSRGVYTARVSSAAETSVRAFPPAKLRLQSRGLVLRPKPGANAVGTLTLPAKRDRASYRLVASSDTVLPAYRGAADAGGSLFATTPFHQSVGAALNVFDGGGNKLWSQSLLAPGGTGASGALDVSRDGSLIATSFVHGEVRVLDRGGALLWEFTVPGDRTGGGPQTIAQTLKFSPDGRRLFVGTGDGRWLLYDVTARSVVWQGQAGINNVGLEALFSSDGSRIYVGDGDGYVRAFDAATGGVVWQRWIGGVSYSMALGGGKLVVSGKSGFSTFALDAATGAVAWSYPQDFQVNNIALSPDGSRAYLAAPDGGGVQCGAVEGGRALWDLGQPCTSVAVDGTGRHILVAGATFAAVLSSEGDVLWQAPLAGKSQFPSAKGFAWISPDAKRLLVVNEATGRVYAFAGSVGS
jgi:outer membrane protein assembly factor BamB